MAQLKEMIREHLQQTYPEYVSCIMIAKAARCERASAYKVLRVLEEEGRVCRKKNAVIVDTIFNGYISDPMLSTRVSKVIGWRWVK
jgi:hypothetical protein